MKIYVNKAETEVESGTSVEQLLKQMGYSLEGGFALAIGTKVIRREDWAATILQEQDKVTIIGATCGG